MKVRLKLVATVARCTLCFGFNSMKVRLKPEAAKVATPWEKFQFHEGPIKTRKTENRGTKGGVSIP